MQTADSAAHSWEARSSGPEIYREPGNSILSNARDSGALIEGLDGKPEFGPESCVCGRFQFGLTSKFPSMAPKLLNSIYGHEVICDDW